MFNIRNIVRQITDRGRDSDPESPYKRSQDDVNSRNAEGFLCPKCMKEFLSPFELQTHYSSTHDEDTVLPEAGVDAMSGSLGSLSISHGGKEQDSPEQDGKINNDLLNLPSAESIENISANTDVADLQHQLRQAVSRKAVLETRVVQLVQSNVALKSKVDELDHELTVLRERHKVVEAQLAHRESIDDAAVLRQELVQVQRVMDEMNRERERERDALQAKLQFLQTQEPSTKELEELKISFNEKEKECSSLKVELENCQKECESLKTELTCAQNESAEKHNEIIKLKLSDGLNASPMQKRTEELEMELAEAKLNLKDMMEKHQHLCSLLETSNNEQLKLKQSMENKNSIYEDISMQLANSKTRIEELNHELVTQHNTINQLQRERSELLTKIQDEEGLSAVVEQLAQRESLLQSLTNENEALKVQNSSIKQCLTKAEKELTFVTVEIKTVSQQNNDFKKRLEENSKIIAGKNSTLQVKETEIKELEMKLKYGNDLCAKLTKDFMKVKEEKINLEKEIQEIKNKKRNLETSLGEVQQTLEELKHEYSSLQEEHRQEVDRLNAALQETSSLLQKQKSAVQLLMSERAELGQKLENAESTHKHEIEEMSLKLQQLQRDFENKVTTLEQLQNTLHAEVEKSTSLQDELNKLHEVTNEAMETKNTEMKKLQVSLDEMTGEKLALEAQLETTNTEQQKLLERCYTATNESDVLQRTVMELRRKLDESEAALQELGRENATLQLDIEKLLGRKWAEDADASKCTLCYCDFTMLVRKHHCRNCGQIFCNDCSSKTAPVVSNKKPVRVCDVCYDELVSM